MLWSAEVDCSDRMENDKQFQKLNVLIAKDLHFIQHFEFFKVRVCLQLACPFREVGSMLILSLDVHCYNNLHGVVTIYNWNWM